MENRSDIRDFIVGLEQQFPVNQWKVNEVCIWPYLRYKLFFYLINELEGQNLKNDSFLNKKKRIFTITNKKKSLILRSKNYLSQVIDYFIFLIRLTQKNYIFFGAKTYRTLYKDKLYNKFFDSYIEMHGLSNDSILMEYDSQIHDNYYGVENIKEYSKVLNGFSTVLRIKKELRISKKINFKIELPSYENYLNFLDKEFQTCSYTSLYKKENLPNLLQDYFLKKDFFKILFKKIKPKQVIVLCYYSNIDSLAAVLAANSLGIKSVELQHGPQTDIHLCYGSWSKVPFEGYDMLPKAFWCWDTASESTIKKWAKDTKVSTKVIGNPWCDFWAQKPLHYEHTNFILYTLQPEPLIFDQLFPEELIKFIKEMDYIWFVRLHPRQSSIKDEFISFCIGKGIFDLINLDIATEEPLPLLLSNCLIHVTHFSGSTLEASFFNKKTILLNESGEASYSELIESEKAFYIPYNDVNFYLKLQDLITNFF